MKKSIIDPEKFEKWAAARLSDEKLFMVKGGGSNPPNPGGGQIPQGPPPEVPAPNNPGNQ